jgi:Mor family transcriptional regulator
MEQLDQNALPEAHRRFAQVIGVEATIRLCQAYGGMPVYIPKLDSVIAAQRARRIRAEYNGENTAALALRYGLSMRSIQKIVSAAPAKPKPLGAAE